MQIIQVANRSQLKEFINQPYRLYQNDPVWVAPLRSEMQGQFDPVKNPLLDHCTYALFLLQEI